MSAGAPVRLPPIAVKLNGETAKTKPSSGRYSRRFQTPGLEIGCSSYIRVMNAGLKRQKSISSHAASISAWWAVFDWPSIVAALSVSRHGPARSSAARRKIAARSSHGTRCQSSQASPDALTAASTSFGPAWCTSASTCPLSCGMTAAFTVPVRTSSPPMISGMSSRSFRICSSRSWRLARSGDPGA